MEGATPNIKYCQYCNTPLLMAIEKEHSCCWDCHYEQKDYPDYKKEQDKKVVQFKPKVK